MGISGRDQTLKIMVVHNAWSYERQTVWHIVGSVFLGTAHKVRYMIRSLGGLVGLIGD